MSLSVDWLRDRVAEYFAAHDIAVPVVYGVERDWRHPDTAARVVLGVKTGPGSFRLLPAGPPGAPGHRPVAIDELGALIDPAAFPGFSGRPIATWRQWVWIAVRAVAPAPEVEDRVRVAQAAASQLLHQVVRAIHEVAHGSHGFNESAEGEWVDADIAHHRHGAMAKLTSWIDIPVMRRSRPRIGLAKPSAPDVTKVNPALELEACNADGCEPVVSTA
jgi:hypothetical protein